MVFQKNHLLGFCSELNEESFHASLAACSNSISAGINVSGTYCPPYLPNRPRAFGLVNGDKSESLNCVGSVPVTLD